MGIGFREFPQNPRGRGFSLLGFYTLFKCFTMFRLVEALNGRLIGSKPWNQNAWILRPTNSPYQFYGLFGLNV